MTTDIEQIWNTYHEIPLGSYIDENTILIQFERHEQELHMYTALEAGPFTGAPYSAPVRSLERLPDPDDTGDITVAVYNRPAGKISVTVEGCGDTVLTRNQARNLARSLDLTLGDL